MLLVYVHERNHRWRLAGTVLMMPIHLQACALLTGELGPEELWKIDLLNI
jgi:hypothetical protein